MKVKLTNEIRVIYISGTVSTTELVTCGRHGLAVHKTFHVYIGLKNKGSLGSSL